MKDEDFLPAVAFQSSPLAILINKDVEGKVIATNQTFISLFGLKRDEVIGHTPVELGIWHTLDERLKLVGAMKAGNTFNNLQLELRHKSGRRILASCSGNRATYNGEPCNVFVIADHTDEVQLRRDLARSELNFRNIFSKTPIMMAISDLSTGRFLDCNVTRTHRSS